jgi:hypothetical protein
VQIMVIRGSASPGQEFAALQFTNTGSKPCRLVGYPAAVLLRGGKVTGGPATPSSSAASSRALAPGEVAESRLDDPTQNCQAPLSEQIRVTAPGMDTTVTRPMVLRACPLHVDKLGPPD